MRLFDAHCHLQDERLVTRAAAVFEAAGREGVAGFCCCGTEEGDWGAVADLAAAHPGVVPAYGLHPWYISPRSPDWSAALAARLAADPRAAVGEIGLDHAIAEHDDADQRVVFAAQLRLAQRFGRPVCIHCRRAWQALTDALDEAGPLPRGFVVHSFSGSAEMLAPLAARGGYFSFSGALTRRHNRRARAAAAATPADRLLIETDAPDLVPFVYAAEGGLAVPAAPDGINEPALLPLVARELAALRGMDAGELATLTTANARRFFLGGGEAPA